VAKVKKAVPICPECQKPSIDGFTHTKCAKKYGIEGLVTLWSLNGVIKKAIGTLKYKYVSDIANELACHVGNNLKNTDVIPFGKCLLLPIPIHWYRENVRGFNQSAEIGKLVSDKLGWKYVDDLLIRKRYTTPQVKLIKSQRQKNIKNAFIKTSKNLPSRSKTIVLFDDVYTTGSTLREAANVLKRSGATRVWALTVAR